MYKKILISLLFVSIFFSLNGCGSGGEPVGGNNSQTFYIDQDSFGQTTQATLRKTVSNVQTRFGSKTLKIWVSNDCYGSGSTKAKAITPNMLNALADAFLKPGDDNDIYDWDTAIYGEEWGNAAHNKYTNLIPGSDEINILLTDIDRDNRTDGGTIGYFYPKDNYRRDTVSGSNERIMFYIDSVMFANGEGGFAGWDIRDRFPSETLSTLAHEFQHMIHFYQKTILLTPKGTHTDTWIDEMLAETTEDVVSTKIGIPGPRGVDTGDGSAGEPNNTRGRYPRFNFEGSTLSLTNWGNSVADYTKVSAFGTYLIRQYGGAKLLHDIMHNPYTDQQAVLDAIHHYPDAENVTFDTLLREWGVAVLLSDKTTLPDHLPQYNTGEFTQTTFHGITYDLGSINFFNYTPQPFLRTGSGTATINPMSNLYYKIGAPLTGNIHVDINLTNGVAATLVMKNHTAFGGNSGDESTFHFSGSGQNIHISVDAGADPVGQFLATGKNISLDLNLSSGSKDVYVVLSNTNDQSGQGISIDNPNNRRAKLTAIHPGSSPIWKKMGTPPSGIIQRVQEFNRKISSYLTHDAKEIR